MNCPHCGNELPNTATSCNRCGKSVVHTAPPKNSNNIGCLGWIIILVLIYCFYTWWVKPMVKKNDPPESSRPAASTTVQEETQSPEELELERQAARLPGVPEEYYNLPIFKNRLYGNCTTLEGDVAITVLFMDDQESYWTQEDMDTFLEELNSVCWDLMSEASLWDKDVNFTIQSTQGYVDEIIYPELAGYGFGNYISSAGFSSNISDLAGTLQARTYSEKVPVIVAFNKWGRSFAEPFVSETSQVERCYIFDDTSAIKHELLHLFGATDFYYHDYVKQAAERELGYSIMSASDNFYPVDEMTAYLIGWTDTLTSNAQNFMYSAGTVGTEALNEAREQNSQNGYFVNTPLSEGRVYTGVLAMGVPNGTGEMFWPNGDHYYGEWSHGLMTYGTFTWANGDSFSGEWSNGERVYGTYTWTSGNVYIGQFLDNNLHGQGTLTFYNGQVQSGYWENGQFIG